MCRKDYASAGFQPPPFSVPRAPGIVGRRGGKVFAQPRRVAALADHVPLWGVCEVGHQRRQLLPPLLQCVSGANGGPFRAAVGEGGAACFPTGCRADEAS